MSLIVQVADGQTIHLKPVLGHQKVAKTLLTLMRTITNVLSKQNAMALLILSQDIALVLA